jgi:hypothetical protein
MNFEIGSKNGIIIIIHIERTESALLKPDAKLYQHVETNG